MDNHLFSFSTGDKYDSLSKFKRGKKVCIQEILHKLSKSIIYMITFTICRGAMLYSKANHRKLHGTWSLYYYVEKCSAVVLKLSIVLRNGDYTIFPAQLRTILPRREISKFWPDPFLQVLLFQCALIHEQHPLFVVLPFCYLFFSFSKDRLTRFSFFYSITEPTRIDTPSMRKTLLQEATYLNQLVHAVTQMALMLLSHFQRIQPAVEIDYFSRIPTSHCLTAH